MSRFPLSEWIPVGVVSHGGLRVLFPACSGRVIVGVNIYRWTRFTRKEGGAMSSQKIETIIVLVLFIVCLVPVAVGFWHALPPSQNTVTEECAIHAHDQAMVGRCLDR